MQFKVHHDSGLSDESSSYGANDNGERWETSQSLPPESEDGNEGSNSSQSEFQPEENAPLIDTPHKESDGVVKIESHTEDISQSISSLSLTSH